MNKTILLTLGLVLLTSNKVGGEHPIPRVPQEPIVMTRTVTTKPSTMKVSKPTIEYVDVELTAYDNCYACTQSGKGITASGVRASRGTVATPKNIKFGTSVYINGVLHRSEDRGGAIVVKSNGAYVIDVWMPTHAQTVKFGRKHGKMYKENGNYYIKY